MTDIVDPVTRSRMMSNIRGKNTKPEMKVRSWLHAAGFRYRLHVSKLAGTPDIVLPKYRLCIFVHGCFWHRHSGCVLTTTPSTRKSFWQKKFQATTLRDQAAIKKLMDENWRVFILWECGLRGKTSLDWLGEIIRGETRYLEWPQNSDK